MGSFRCGKLIKFKDTVTKFNRLCFVNKWNTNQIVREIRMDLLRLNILADPNMAAMYRSSKKKSFVVHIYYLEISIALLIGLSDIVKFFS